MQLIILGMHRSGTSATARLLNLMGAYFAPEGVALPADLGNPKGYWERRDVVQINEGLLAQQQSTWHILANWDESRAVEATVPLKRAMHHLILEMDAHRPWLLKDPRLCITLPAWLPLLEAPVIIAVYRNPLEIALSLHARSNMPKEHALALWEFYSVNMLNASLGLPRIFVEHKELMRYPVESVKKLHQSLQTLEVPRLSLPSSREVNAFISPLLYRAQVNETTLSAPQRLLCDYLRGARVQQEKLTCSEASIEILKQLLKPAR